ncbi:MAG: M15 family metallopeptidase [Lachnospiraceae bacterium]|nr:M15 family metallopeptidase [Lachnospiraceae bacterium]
MRRRNRRLFFVFTAIVLVLLVILFALRWKNKSGSGEGMPGAVKGASGPESGNAADGDSGEEDDGLAPREMVTFDEGQMHRGDLVLVSSSHAYDFEANAATIGLVNIREAQNFTYQVGKPEFEIAQRVMPHLDELVAACDAAVGTKMTGVASAYRSMEYQQEVWKEMEDLYGQEYAEKYVAAPGYSEHHTGLAVDMSIFYEDGSEGTFSESENAYWMNENSYHYGFIRRYAEDKVGITGISNEAWHFRYVGVPHATFMKEKNLCLEEYIDLLRTNTTAENPLVITCDTGTFEVYFTAEESIEKPAGEYAVSGNNVDGYIITVEQ